MNYIKIYLILLIHLCLSDDTDYYCWRDASERHTLTFINNPNKTITHLPQIRLIEGYYGSQFAMQYAAYVYLKERMGVNVTFYPENNANAISERYAGYTGWCNTTNSSTCSRYAPYPQFYFDDIANDEYDLLFEMWDVMVKSGNGDNYFQNDHVLNGGMSGVYGEGGWFMPKYTYDSYPDTLLPIYLKNNAAERQMFIDAYTNGSINGTNYINQWWEIWNSSIDTYNAYGFGTPDELTPVIFGSYHGYAISEYSGKLVNNLLDSGINWTFAAFGSEGALTSYITDLYSKQLPFIANLYGPHLDFATVLPNTTGYMEFERIALPRNPNNDVGDICYQNGECAFPLSPLIKIGNPKLQSRYYEMFRFLLEYKMLSTDVNDIIAYYQEAAAYNLSSGHEQWINASCKWLKENNETTDEWYQDIIRYDCIFNIDGEETDYCGFNYYYSTKEDAKNDVNAVYVASYETVAGSCMNDTNEPLCDCPSQYFVGDTCRDSCPGIIGPIYSDSCDSDSCIDDHDNITSHIIRMDGYLFYLCNGNGICDIDRKSCECLAGFGGDSCDIKYAVFEYGTGLIAVWVSLFSICLIILVLSIAWVYTNSHYKSIKALSVKLTITFTFGMILLCISTVLFLFHPLNDALCAINNYLLGVGAIITIMAPLCKTYRVSLIFGQKEKKLQRIKIPDKQLLMYVGYAVIFETIICSIYTMLHQLNGGVDKLYLDEFLRVEYVCNQSSLVAYISAANYLYIFTLIMILCFFSFKNRSAFKIFKESRCAYFGSFFSLFVFLVVLIFNMTTNDITYIIGIQSGAMFIALSVIWGLFYGVRILKFITDPESRDAMTTANTSTTSTMSSIRKPMSNISNNNAQQKYEKNEQ